MLFVFLILVFLCINSYPIHTNAKLIINIAILIIAFLSVVIGGPLLSLPRL